MGIWSRTYVCCAVPLYNSGIYAILAQFGVVSIVAGVLAFAAPDIIAVAVPSFGAYIFGGLAILVGCTQLIGFLGVYRERPAQFKTYHVLNMCLIAATLIVAVAFIAISAARHSTAVTTCEQLFSTDTASSSSEKVCGIWVWVQIGIMGLLWVLITICEVYFIMYAGIYASEQRLDHARYDSVYSSAAEEIRQSEQWEQGRPSLSHNPPTRDPSSLRHEYPNDDEPEFPAEYRQPANHLYAPDHNQSYHDDPYNQQAGQGYYPQQDQYAGQYAPDHHDGYAPPIEGHGAQAGGYSEKDYNKQEAYEYANYGEHHDAPPGPSGGRWDHSGYR